MTARRQLPGLQRRTEVVNVLTGTLDHWDDARGFGFIRTAEGERVFVHISEIGRIATRPRIGDQMRFTQRTGTDGRLQATNVRIAGANPTPGPDIRRRGAEISRRRPGWRIGVAIALSLVLALALAFGRVPLGFVGLYLVMGLVSVALYRADKRQAQAGAWRTPEAVLLGVDLAFGVIGGLLAQDFFRHKTIKPAYVAATLLVVGVHAAWLLGLAAGQIDATDLAEPGSLVGL